MTYHAYLFESRSIQPYIFAGGRLRDIVSASNLIDQLTGDDLTRDPDSVPEPGSSILDDVLLSLDIVKPVEFSRRAGGAFYAISEDVEAITQLAQLWPLVVSGIAPGLEMLATQASGESEFKAVKNGLDVLKVKRNFPAPQFPLVPPVAQRAQRTGEGAVVNFDILQNNQSGSNIPEKLKNEAISRSTEIKRRYARQGAAEQQSGVRRALASKFKPDNAGNIVWPKSLTEEEGLRSHEVLPLADENSYVALVHIDGNGLGQLLLKLNQEAEQAKEEYKSIYLDISRAIASATQEAAKAAMEVVLKPVSGNTIAAIPLVLGGDDITLIVTAKYALAFAESYMREFEHLSSERFKDIKDKYPQQKGICAALPDYLSACAGIAFCKATYPFQYASQLAEELCKKAKKATSPYKDEKNNKPQPGGLCWHKVTTTSIATVDDIFDFELIYQRRVKTASEDKNSEDPEHRLSLGTYVIADEVKQLPNLSAFLALQNKVLGLSAKASQPPEGEDSIAIRPDPKLGKLREYMGYLKSNPSQAKHILSRFWETDSDFLEEVMAHLRAIWKDHDLLDAFTYQTSNGSVSLLADLIASASLADTEHTQGEG